MTASGPYKASVLALIAGSPPRVLVVRKNCRLESPWRCDVALPGGRVKGGEGLIEAALREAWEEAFIHPCLVSPIAVTGPFPTMNGLAVVYAVVARPRGPLDPMPRDREVDFAGWVRLDAVASAGPVEHPARGVVYGVRLPGGLVLWGVTLRILSSLLGVARSGVLDVAGPY
ncbi:MAG: NUDIX domain-containing protein [Desulfurococcales archaeon]|nr:NUDIX domain-containing protein [Desulfurococcales archaeon]